MLPEPLDPYLYRARFRRAVDGDTAVLSIDQGFGVWQLASKFPGGPDARYPQGRYRLNGINTPELNQPGGRDAHERVKELISLSDKADELLVRTVKHGKFRFLVDLFVRTVSKITDPFTDGTLDVEDEDDHWLGDEDLMNLVQQTQPGSESTIRALATEVLWRRRQLNGGGNVIHVNQQLLDEGLAKPYAGGSK